MGEKVHPSDLVDFFKFIISKSENGLAILLGIAPPPGAVQMYEMLGGNKVEYGVRIDGGEKIPQAQRILESVEHLEDIISAVGGWREIHAATLKFKADYPDQWKILETHALFVRPGGLLRDGQGGMSAIICRRHSDITPKTLRRRYKKILRALAIFLLSWSYSDGFNLNYFPKHKRLN
ncbi:hypothetical protein [Synergistes jonesii]|uniref:Uncharacterized protein n=1 Tax=Synergistes jonesii TaxID=2754 RepID=A0A073IN22_9BACT|nr:hypothetical protein [Synergistes jonesii]KEJ91119.1 hypothetical protein EH55_13155 [Synergistes jonesii]OFB60232.1 hypothetical protein JS73_12965 [Synergistes jonesii]OFB60957.1 hypothetical protein JS79_12600 [Synergistes jonesii]OFB64601.1 hypothetical protein JS72_03905 [Synergistes jonesii]OFB66439.1 hypothetical protein JS78_12985 [Synergistes jonesii]